MMLILVPAMRNHPPPHLKASVHAASGSSTDQLAAMATLTFDQLVAQSGINPTVVSLFRLRGIAHTNLIYHLLEKTASSESMIDELAVGVATGADPPAELKLDAVSCMIQKAALRAAWDLLDDARRLSRPVATPMTAALPAGAGGETKVPKTLPTGYWTERIREFNEITVDGRPRKFPTNYLLGGEDILARMVHEHKESKMYTPPILTEIVCGRDMTSTGEPSPYARGRHSLERKLLPDENGFFSEMKRRDPEAYTAGLLLEGIETTKWALIFARWSTEEAIEAWIGWWTKMAKDNPDKNWQIREFWVQAHYHLTTALRSSEGFPQAIKEIMTSNMKAEALSKTKPRGTKGDDWKGGGKADTKGLGKGRKKRHLYDNEWSPPKRPKQGKGAKGNSVGRPQDRICKFFAQGTCQQGASCPFAHRTESYQNWNTPAPPPPAGNNYFIDKGKGGGKNAKGGKGKGKGAGKY